ncbi:MAG: trypsin-like peptidase domain-containing protein [Candidatus Latescibacteria bacterium]|nr:trypsin-like peptidase domain-containing protein [Candidatus Latescibacterota bacterium]
MLPFRTLPVVHLLLLCFAPTMLEAQGTLLREMEAELAAIVQQVHPSVVTIVAHQPRQFDETLIPGEEKVLWQRNIGSGVIFDQEGYILTTTHVIDQATDILVSFVSGGEAPARLIGGDTESQIAVIKVDQRCVVSAKLSDSNYLRLNHWAVILGNSSGLFPSASLGLICGWRDESGLFQIAAPSSPGISGAPVFNSSGEVVGIIVFAIVDGGAVLSPSGGTSGASLAVPINRAKMVVHSLIQHGYVEYGWLGVGFAKGDDGSATIGVRLSHVFGESPAMAAGLRRGDLILQYGNVTVRSVYHLAEMVRSTLPGTRIPIRIQRDGRQTMCSVIVGSRRPHPPHEVLVQDPNGSLFQGKRVEMFNVTREMR